MNAVSGPATAQAEAWTAAWNGHDLECILTLYDEDAVMASAKIRLLGLDDSGVLRGKDQLRRYWAIGLARRPGLRFALVQVFSAPDSLVLRYCDERGHDICEYLRYGANGLIVQGSANHLIA